jgi:hypothetical protein
LAGEFRVGRRVRVPGQGDGRVVHAPMMVVDARGCQELIVAVELDNAPRGGRRIYEGTIVGLTLL